MEVTKRNFDSELLAIIDEAIAGADFIAIDTEFTGLGVDNDLLDTPQERYTKQRASCQNFIPTQVGLALFAWDAGSKAYICRPFSFYVYPKSSSKFLGLDRTFSAQASSLEFLSSNNFDFNKWIGEGISFINPVEEANLRAKIDTLDKEADMVIEDRHRKFVDDAIASTTDWLQNAITPVFSHAAPSSYHKRMLHQEIKKAFNGFVTTENQRTTVDVRRLTVEERDAKRSDNRSAQFLSEVDNLVGFRKSYEEFKTKTHEYFPKIFDTKHIALSNANIQSFFINSTLCDVFAVAKTTPFEHPRIEFAEKYDRFATEINIQLHDASYDAYITGVSFLRMLGYITSVAADSPLDWSHDYIGFSENKLHIMRSDIAFLSIAGPDGNLYDFPASWKTSEILQRFKELGQMTVKWIGDTSCLLILRDRKMIPLAQSMAKPKNTKSKEYKLAEWTGKTAQPSTVAATTHTHTGMSAIPEQKHVMTQADHQNNAHTLPAATVEPESVVSNSNQDNDDDVVVARFSKRKLKRQMPDTQMDTASVNTAARESTSSGRKRQRTLKKTEDSNGCAIM
eukprot:jgi/Hompol1/4624/HPOL_003761-RA